MHFDQCPERWHLLLNPCRRDVEKEFFRVVVVVIGEVKARKDMIWCNNGDFTNKPKILISRKTVRVTVRSVTAEVNRKKSPI